MYSVNPKAIKHFLLGFVVLLNLVAGSGQTSAATAYACIRVVRADPGYPTAPTITLPAGYTQVTSTGYAVSSEGEFYVFVQGPDGIAPGATVSWPGVPFTDIIMNDTHLTLGNVATNRDAATCDIPVHATSLRNAWPTFEIHSFFNESDLAIRVEHNLTYRRAGWYADHPWVSGQARAVVNYIFASRLIMRDWGIQHRVATAKAGSMSLLGFESNDPVHVDYPPHLHLIMYLPTAANAGTKIPHFYMDDHGLITANKIQVLSHPELGDQYLYANQPM
ncbi:MAG: hypothetical protein H0W83_09725, partial [Planctomycetes bacterium]|nr:hypothetical protein [Planctomycetota bacterium]